MSQSGPWCCKFESQAQFNHLVKFRCLRFWRSAGSLLVRFGDQPGNEAKPVVLSAVSFSPRDEGRRWGGSRVLPPPGGGTTGPRSQAWWPRSGRGGWWWQKTLLGLLCPSPAFQEERPDV